MKGRALSPALACAGVTCAAGGRAESMARNRERTCADWALPASALVTFAASWAGAYPPALVERWYARGVFPVISRFAEKVADAVSFAWLDVAVPLGLVCALLLIRRGKWRWLLNLISVLYLMFFWSSALNYHRQPLTSIQRHPAPNISRHVQVFAFDDRRLAFVKAAFTDNFQRQMRLAHL